jgi:hypothetical protein
VPGFTGISSLVLLAPPVLVRVRSQAAEFFDKKFKKGLAGGDFPTI